MKNITIDFNKNCGKVKPMHAVNNGPVYKFVADMRITNMPAWIEAGIPYARTHDSPYYSTYGGPHIIDVNLIFTNFDADPYDENSYDFACTDEYLKVIDYSGTKIFYRLGASIEHWVKKYNTLPPKDFKKWAIICEHIIKHYTAGWANGFEYDIEYWEIWNEPDLDPEDATNKRTWGGTKAQFFEFYATASKHLKACFPHLKIGGPALCHDLEYAREFLKHMKECGAVVDFFSWHRYAYEPVFIAETAQAVRNILDEEGFEKTESINNEWNYVRGWEGDTWIYSLRTEKNLKGSSFILGTMCACTYVPIDMLMYYDARPGRMNGLFNSDLVCDILKGYYPFKMFNELYKLDNAVAVENDENLLSAAAVSENKAAIIFTHFCDDDATPTETVKLNMKGFCSKNGVKASYYLLDWNNDLELVKEEVLSGEDFATVLNSELYSSYLVVLEKI